MVLLPERRTLERDPEECGVRDTDATNPDAVPSISESVSGSFSRIHASYIRESHSDELRNTCVVKFRLCDTDRYCANRRTVSLV